MLEVFVAIYVVLFAMVVLGAWPAVVLGWLVFALWTLSRRV